MMFRPLIALSILVAACGQVESSDEQRATCTPIGVSYIYGVGSFMRYECDSDPGEGCAPDGNVYLCPAALTQANVVCP